MADGVEFSFGERVRLLRERRSLSQAELGRSLHMTQRKISYLENDRYEPGVEDIRALCRFFGVSADYLLGLSPNLTNPKP